MEAERAKALVSDLIDEGNGVLATERESERLSGVSFVDLQTYSKWTAGCATLLHMLGEHAAPWRERILETAKKRSSGTSVRKILGTLSAIQDALDRDLLHRVEDLARADVFAELLDQADYLEEKGFHLAAGVLGRAVLEDHLRTQCDRKGCAPTKVRPTIEDHKQELYKAKHIDKLNMKLVDVMADIGNSAAHNKSSFKPETIERFLQDVRDFLTRYPL